MYIKIIDCAKELNVKLRGLRLTLKRFKLVRKVPGHGNFLFIEEADWNNFKTNLRKVKTNEH